jgi:hypothetical protein
VDRNNGNVFEVQRIGKGRAAAEVEAVTAMTSDLISCNWSMVSGMWKRPSGGGGIVEPGVHEVEKGGECVEVRNGNSNVGRKERSGALVSGALVSELGMELSCKGNAFVVAHSVEPLGRGDVENLGKPDGVTKGSECGEERWRGERVEERTVEIGDVASDEELCSRVSPAVGVKLVEEKHECVGTVQKEVERTVSVWGGADGAKVDVNKVAVESGWEKGGGIVLFCSEGEVLYPHSGRVEDGGEMGRVKELEWNGIDEHSVPRVSGEKVVEKVGKELERAGGMIMVRRAVKANEVGWDGTDGVSIDDGVWAANAL